jgi:hypothetical protein
MNQVLAMEYRDTGEVLKRAVYKVVVIACATYAWVGMESGKYGVAKAL